MKTRAVTKAVVAVLSPGIALLVFRAGVWLDFANNRAFDAGVAVPLAIGGYCGVAAFRSKDATLGVRGLGLLGAVVCVPYAVMMASITMFGLG